MRYRWAIGDIQGCFDAFEALLQKIDFDPGQDELWLVGDLVSRGDKSLETLRYIYAHQDAIRCVLGNHDLGLIAAHYGIKKPNATLLPVLEASDAKRLIEWLQRQPLLCHDDRSRVVMVHAGIAPQMTLEEAKHFARQIEAKLQGDRGGVWLRKVMATQIDHPSKATTTLEKESFALNAFVRMRYCRVADGSLDFEHKEAPSRATEVLGLVPWFGYPERKAIEPRIFFGHWSTLGYYKGKGLVCLDTGCVWKRELTAYRIDDGMRISVKC